jgi:hypothetical protein
VSDYDVSAELNVRTSRTLGGLNAVAARLDSITSTLTRIAVGYVGFQVIGGAFRMAVQGAIGFNAQLEQTRISLASVLSATQGTSFLAATEQAGEVFNQLRDDAIRSTATTSELFSIYQSILGPLRQAGASMEVVRELTNNTVAASSALGVDFGQAQRDIQMMATGVAGTDVKLFRMLRSVGAIAEDAQAFNELTAPQRVERIRSALGRFEVAAQAYGQSWAGVTSTFRDIVGQLMATAGGPAFERIKRFVSTINERLLANRERLEAGMRRIGISVSMVLGRVFEVAMRGFDYVLAHWDQIVTRITRAVAMVQRFGPTLAKLALALVALRFGQRLLGMGGGGGAAAAAPAAASGGASLFRTLIGTALGGALARVLFRVITNSGTIREIGEAFGFIQAPARSFLSTLLSSTTVFRMLAFLAPALIALAVAIGALMVAAVAAWGLFELWRYDSEAFTATFARIRLIFNMTFSRMRTGAERLYTALQPLLRLIGVIALSNINYFLDLLVVGLIALEPAIQATVFALELLLGPLRQLAAMAGLARPGVTKAFGELTEEQVAENETILSQLGEGGGGHGRWDPSNRSNLTPNERASNVNDFRGSRFEVHQEFREADPDRVALSMIEDVARAAEQRVQSGFANPLSR